MDVMHDTEHEDPAGTAAPAPTLTPAAVARRLGVAAATLRTWDRRYGLGPSEHTAGAHRRYTAADVARLMTMRSLTLDGVAPADAARIARASDDLGAVAPVATGPGPGVPSPGPAPSSSDVPDAAPEGVPTTVSRPASDPPSGRGGAGGRLQVVTAGTTHDGAPVLPTPRASATATAVIDAALRGDGAAVRALLAPGEDLAQWWADLVVPVRSGIAARTVLARPGDEPDVLVTATALAALRERAGRVPPHPSRRRVVLMLAPAGEPRPLSLHVLAGALADAGVDARVLAGPLGSHRLLEIVTMTSPSAVVLISEQATPDLGTVAALVDARGDLPLYAMVPAEAVDRLPLGHEVHRVRTVPGLLHEVLAAVSGG